MTRETFYQRLEVCKTCPYWRNVCLKGHSLRSSAGCPIRKFDPVDAADYARDREVDLTPAGAGCQGCGNRGLAEIKPLTWPEAFAHLGASLKEWRAKGFPVLEGPAYDARIEKCKSCPEYGWFQCRLCRCFAYTKAKLASESCPAGRW